MIKAKTKKKPSKIYLNRTFGFLDADFPKETDCLSYDNLNTISLSNSSKSDESPV